MTSSSSLSKAGGLTVLGAVLLVANSAMVATLPGYGWDAAVIGEAVALIPVAAAAFYWRRSFALLNEVADVLAAASIGNLEMRIFAIPEPGLIGRLQRGTNTMLDVSDAFMREAAGSAKYLSERKYFRKVLPRGLPGVFNIAATSMNGAAETMAANVEDFTHFAENNVGSVVDGITSAATQLQSAAEAMSTMANDLTVLTAEIGGRATHSSALAEKVSGEVGETVTTVRQLSAAAQTVQNVVDVISEFSRKTELLAINASIEAAKAGLMGRGFAVVATEIKALAVQTEGATRDIAAQIRDMVQVVGRVEEAISAIRVSVSDMNDASKGIASAITDESTSATAPSIASAVAGTGVASSQVLGAASDLMDEAGRLGSEIAAFVDKVRGG